MLKQIADANLSSLALGGTVVALALFVLFQIRLRRAVRSESRGRKISEESYKTLFESSPEGVLVLDGAGRIRQCNPAAGRMVGYAPGELIGRSVIDFSPDIQPETGFFSEIAAKMFLEKSLAGQTQHFEWAHLHKNGSEVLTQVLLAPFGPKENGELLGLWRDVTELKKLQQEKELQQAVLIQQTKLAELGGMIGAIAHQWKQPLNAIALIAQDLPDSLEAGELDAATLTKRSDRIMEQIRFMAQTIDDFRNFYRPIAEVRPFSPKKAAASVAELLKTQLLRHRVGVTIEGDGDAQALGYENEFKQVALNLINNARDAAEERGLRACLVNIRVERNNDRVRIAFADNAGGIPDQLLPKRLFEPFVSTKGEKGTGIGLSLAKTIIEEKMHGRLSAENTGEGALFTIDLPLLKENL